MSRTPRYRQGLYLDMDTAKVVQIYRSPASVVTKNRATPEQREARYQAGITAMLTGIDYCDGHRSVRLGEYNICPACAAGEPIDQEVRDMFIDVVSPEEWLVLPFSHDKGAPSIELTPERWARLISLKIAARIIRTAREKAA